jgi:DHA2 family multidrug resistance protein
MLWGVTGFAIASLLCGTATSVEELVFYRILQGACGAPLVPLSQAILLDTYPRAQHGPATAFFGIGVILGPIIAPTLGGYLSDNYGWRWVFFMIVPFALVSLLGVWAFIVEHRAARSRLDWTGFLTLAVAIASLQLMLDRGERNDWFDSAEIIFEAGLALGAFYVFVVHSLTAERPFFNPKMLRNRNFAVGLAIVLIFGMLNFTPITLLPTLLQNLRGYPDTVIGLVLSARGFGTLIGFALMIFASRMDPRIPLALGLLLQAYAGWTMAQFDINLTTWGVIWTTAIQGLGVGLMWVPLSMIALSTLPPDQRPDGTAFFHLLRNIGSSIFISLSITLVIRSTKVSYAGIVEQISPFSENLHLPWVTGAWSIESTRGLMALSKEALRQATMIGYLNSFLAFALVALVALPLVLLAKWHRR